MILGNIMAVPEDVREVLWLDRRQRSEAGLYITIPMIKDMLRTVSILSATAGFLLYNEVYFRTKGSSRTYSISYVIRELAITSTRTQFGRANAVADDSDPAGMLIIVF